MFRDHPDLSYQDDITNRHLQREARQSRNSNAGPRTLWNRTFRRTIADEERGGHNTTLKIPLTYSATGHRGGVFAENNRVDPRRAPPGEVAERPK